MAGMWARPGARASAADLPQLRDLQPIVLGPLLHRFLAPSQRLGDRADRHALAGERMQLLDLVLPPRLPMPLEPLAHCALPSSADFYYNRRSIMDLQPLFAQRRWAPGKLDRPTVRHSRSSPPGRGRKACPAAHSGSLA